MGRKPAERAALWLLLNYMHCILLAARNNCTRLSTSCILTAYILHTAYFLHPASCILHLSLHPASCTLYPASCILHPDTAYCSVADQLPAELHPRVEQSGDHEENDSTREASEGKAIVDHHAIDSIVHRTVGSSERKAFGAIGQGSTCTCKMQG